MAHKHSRHRQRPRWRNHDATSLTLYQQQPAFQPSWYDPMSFSTGTATKIAWNDMIKPNRQGNLSLINFNNNANIRSVVPTYGPIGSRLYRAPKLGSNNALPSLMDKAELEEEQIKLFGGEPGDDPGLCFKMLEVFGRMEWIDG